MYEITTSYLCKNDTYKKIWCYCGIQKPSMMYLSWWITAECIISSPRLPSENSGTWGTSWPDQAHKCDRWLFFRSLDPFKKGFNKTAKHLYEYLSRLLFQSVAEMQRHGLNRWLSAWWEGRAKPGQLRCVRCTWVTGWGGGRIHPFPDLI